MNTCIVEQWMVLVTTTSRQYQHDDIIIRMYSLAFSHNHWLCRTSLEAEPFICYKGHPIKAIYLFIDNVRDLLIHVNNIILVIQPYISRKYIQSWESLRLILFVTLLLNLCKRIDGFYLPKNKMVKYHRQFLRVFGL